MELPLIGYGLEPSRIKQRTGVRLMLQQPKSARGSLRRVLLLSRGTPLPSDFVSSISSLLFIKDGIYNCALEYDYC